jgi:Cytochrome P460
MNRISNAAISPDNAANTRWIAVISLAIPAYPSDTAEMLNKFQVAILLTIATLSASLPGLSQNTPEYTSDSQLNLPANYRGWVYLSTGFDMSYNPSAQMADHHMFDNVFVSPESYKAFVETGTWPDKTMLVLEVRGAEGKGSINQKGNYQSTDVMGLEVHVKDTARFPGGWAFFGFDDSKTAKMVPVKAECYSCHAAHAAVDTTFVQFYPTLLPIAKAKGTLSAAYQKDAAAEVKK